MGDSRGISPLSLEGNVAENWRLWRARFENYLVATEIGKKDDKIKCAQLLHYLGEEAFKIYSTFKFEEEEKGKLDFLLQKFEAHFRGKENISYERYKFFSYKQNQGQSTENFVTELKKQAVKCKLENLQDSLIVTMIICGVKNNLVRERLLQEEGLSLEKAVELCYIIESSKLRSEAMGNNYNTGTIEIDKIRVGQKGETVEKKTIKDCSKCGRSHVINKCPAFGKKCNFCRIDNHFEIVCRKKRSSIRESQRNKGQNINEVSDDTVVNSISVSDSNYVYIGSIDKNKLTQRQAAGVSNSSVVGKNSTTNEKQWLTTLEINKKQVNFKIDTGAMANVLPLKIFKLVGFSTKIIKNTNVKLQSYTGSDLKVIGSCRIPCFIKGRYYYLDFYVVNSDTQAILGLDSSINLNLIMRVDSLDSVNANEYTDIIKKYKDLFSGIGCIKKKYHIEIEPDAKPVIYPCRKVAVPLLNSLKHSLEDLERQQIIKKVEGASKWVNPLVLVKKPDGKLRICLDPQALNKVIKREYCQIPTLEQIVSKLNGATVFSTLDATQGFYQVPLDEASMDLCTFGTPFGRYKFLRMPYGIKSAPEVFQTIFKEIFNIKGADTYIDDLLVWGRTKEEHDARLKQVLEIAHKNNVRFNLSKCKFGQKQIKYMGHIISDKGLSPDYDKIKAINEITEPVNKQDVQRLLGMLTYVSKFIKNFSEITDPLRSLLRKDVEFMWESEHKVAFQKLKNILTSKPVLQFYDVNAETVVSVDASCSGLGACLKQNNLPCAYASRAMTETQCRYAQIEKELLGITFGLNRFHEYIFGKRVIVETDHLPLISIFKKPLNKCPAKVTAYAFTNTKI